MSLTKYDIIKSPLISEKLQDLSEKGIYAFSVDNKATRVQIKKAVEELYNVKVDKVNVMSVVGKKKRLRIKQGYTPSWKKAVVRLEEGQTISLV